MKSKARKSVFSLIWLVSTLALTAAASELINDSGQTELRQLKGMQATISHDGLPGLLTSVSSNRYPAPRIYSLWYVERIASKEPVRVKLEHSKREFGLQVAKALEQEAKRAETLTDNEARRQETLCLLNLGEWIAGGLGYGNEYLSRRCFDIATIPLAYLIADLEYPLEDARQLLEKSPSDESGLTRVATVLNLEAGREIFPKPFGSRDQMFEQLQQVRGKHIREILKWLEEHPEYGSRRPSELQNVLPTELAFFCDDDLAKPPTVVNMWDKKWHEMLLGVGSQNVGLLRALLLFRDKVGQFPESPPPSYKPSDRFYLSAIDAAFHQAWKPYRSEYGIIDGRAAIAYERVKHGKFLDAERQ
jgi:hypothetical protein